MSRPMRLPLELIFSIMSIKLPSNPTALIPPSHEATQLLLRFSTVCRATHKYAVRKLQQHCIYIDSENRLRRFLLCLEESRKSNFESPSVFQGVPSLYLAPFEKSLDNHPAAFWTRELFCYVRGSLKRLIMDMPLDSLPPWHDHLDVGPMLREGFDQLDMLEEFVCTRDAFALELFQNGSGSGENADADSYLKRWPHLRRLAINRAACDERFWGWVASRPHLERVFLASSLAFVFLSEIAGSGHGTAYQRLRQKRITIVSGNIKQMDLDFNSTASQRLLSLESTRPQNGMRLLSYKIPILPRKRYLDSASEWIIDTALKGELWEVHGFIPTTLATRLMPYPIHHVAEGEDEG